MAISKRPGKVDQPARPIDVNEIINRGGTPPKEVTRPIKEKKGLLLNINAHQIEIIDKLAKERKVPVSRSHWICEAILEKIEREQTLP